MLLHLLLLVLSSYSTTTFSSSSSCYYYEAVMMFSSIGTDGVKRGVCDGEVTQCSVCLPVDAAMHACMPSPISSCLTNGESEPPPSFPILAFPFPFSLSFLAIMDNQAPTFLTLFIYEGIKERSIGTGDGKGGGSVNVYLLCSYPNMGLIHEQCLWDTHQTPNNTCDTSTERTVKIEGNPEQIESAKQLVNQVISGELPSFINDLHRELSLAFKNMSVSSFPYVPQKEIGSKIFMATHEKTKVKALRK
ncbi:hypothetical protein Ahy_B04g069427 isoform B [Arachis hypogaea]|uniref:K Homology domain-containing protein n=1 Tax=Arachis hypogaea TaxID=3818 RepID=A0A444ZCK9_ARAHY|nr:hypothetical protein Ahy_B04g069427 isoform B [Arachis hypogaea]